MGKRIRQANLIIIIAMLLSGCGDNAVPNQDMHEDEHEAQLLSYICAYEGTIPTGAKFTDGQETNKDVVFFDREKLFRCMEYVYDFDNMLGTVDLISLDSGGNTSSAEWPFGLVYPRDIGSFPYNDSLFATNWVKDEDSDYYKATIYIYDYEYNEKKEIELDFLEAKDKYSYAMAIDRAGYIHIDYTDYAEDRFESSYMIASPEGELLFSQNVGEYRFNEFVVLYDGSIAAEYLETIPGDVNKGTKQYLIKYDDATGEKTILREYVEFNTFNLFDENTYVCGEYYQGIFLCDTDLDNKRIIFSWEDNELSNRYVDKIQAFEDGTITLTYTDETNVRGFMVLKPGTREQIREVEFAVSPLGKTHYTNAVREYNRTHHDVKIVMNDEYNKTLLLTKLAAGDGPALVEANYIGFEKQAKLWDVIDFGEDSDITANLNDAALELGTINGNLYGVMQDFAIETFACYLDDDELDFDHFISKAEKNEGIKALVNQADSLNLATYYFDHGLDDSMYIDSDGKLKLDLNEFGRIVGIIEELGCTSKVSLSEDPLLSGEVLGETVYIRRPEDLIYYKNHYGEDVNLSGYPGANGAVSYIFDPYILAIPSKADTKDKEVALDFLKMLLSRDYQMRVKDELSFNLSVRKDVLKEQIMAVTADTYAWRIGESDKALTQEPDNIKNEKALTKLIEDSKAYPYYRYEDYTAILREEFEEYFYGRINAEALADRIEKRVGIYAMERR